MEDLIEPMVQDVYEILAEESLGLIWTPADTMQDLIADLLDATEENEKCKKKYKKTWLVSKKMQLQALQDRLGVDDKWVEYVSRQLGDEEAMRIELLDDGNLGLMKMAGKEDNEERSADA